jgi:hypothetical protein
MMSDASFNGKQAQGDVVYPEFFDVNKFNLTGTTTLIRLISHQIRLDSNGKAKNFYVMQVLFKEREDHSQDNNGKPKKDDKKGKAAKEAQQIIHQIQIEKVYGDFKRLNEHIVETF